MGLKLFGQSGVDTRSNHLVKDQSMLRDARNIRFNEDQCFEKRPGVFDFDNPDHTFNYINKAKDTMFYRQRNSFFYVSDEEFHQFQDSRSSEPLDFLTGNGFPVSAAVFSYFESMGCIYFVNPDKPTQVMKYDGDAVYNSGLPSVEWKDSSGIPASVSPWCLFYFSFIDAQGNLINGPYKTARDRKSIEAKGENDLVLYNGFKRTRIYISPPATPSEIVIDKNNRSITTTSYSGIKVGSKITFRSGIASKSFFSNLIIGVVKNADDVNTISAESSVQFEIESISMGVITFTEDSIRNYTITIDTSGSDGSEFNISGDMVIRAWSSDNEFTGWASANTIESTFIVQRNETDVRFPTSTPFGMPVLDFKLSNEYDVTTSKIRPPECRYVALYGNQMVCAGVSGFFDFNNSLNTYTNDDMIIYSDLNAGDFTESFTELNRQLIGRTEDGSIKGIKRIKDSLIIFKNRSIEAIDGILMPGTFIRRDVSSKYSSTHSLRSIGAYQDVLYFQSKDGICATDSFDVEEASSMISTVFKTADVSVTVMSSSEVNKEIYFFLKRLDENILVVFDVRQKGVYLWNGIDAEKGMHEMNDGEMVFFTSNGQVKKLVNGALNDQGDPINAYLKTAWLDNKEPGILKKINGFRIYSFNNKGQEIDFNLHNNWTENRENVSSTIEEMINPNVVTKHQKTGTFTAQSFSLTLKNNKVNQDLSISGYEIDWQNNQFKDKNVK